MKRTLALVALLALLGGCDVLSSPPVAPEAVDVTTPALDTTPDPTATSTAQPAPTPTPTKTTPKPTPKKTTAPPKAPKPAGNATVAERLLAQINQWRAAKGLKPLTMAAGLVSSAHKHNLRMSAGCGLKHECSGEKSLGARISAEGVRWSRAGENIGTAWRIANNTSAIWTSASGLNTSMFNEKPPDDGHRQNILGAGFTRIGIDVIVDSSGHLWLTQDFAG